MTRPEKDKHKPAEPSAGEGPHGGDQRVRRKGRWLVALKVLVFLALAAFTVRWGRFGHRSNALSAAYKASQPPGFAIGDLGGMPVKVPRNLAELLEEPLRHRPCLCFLGARLPHDVIKCLESWMPSSQFNFHPLPKSKLVIAFLQRDSRSKRNEPWVKTGLQAIEAVQTRFDMALDHFSMKPKTKSFARKRIECSKYRLQIKML